MENGSFQNMELSALDFAEPAERIQKPKEDFHQILDFIEIPRDLRKSSTVESLLQQNEDLMARLKVCIRRLSLLEDENKALVDKTNEVDRNYSAISDQMLVWKEKEKVWKARLDKSEDALRQFQDRFPNYIKMEAQVERYQRYKERVQTTFKPYISKLKEEITGLQSQCENLSQLLEQKDAQLTLFANQLAFKKEELAEKIQFYEMSQIDLVSNFEKQKAELVALMNEMKKEKLELLHKAKALNQSLERQDDLENTIISLKRAKEELQQEIQSEMQALKKQTRELRQAVVEKDLAIEELSGKKMSLQEQLQQETFRREELEEQLTSLRYMWSGQSEENKKLEVSVASLEKLNADLSAKLNALRKNS
jgi:chromosome segregation ATPase